MTRIVRATRERSRWWLGLPLLAAVLVTLVLVQGAFSQPSKAAHPAKRAAPGKTAALACGAQVSASVTLTADITGCTGDGIDVMANGVAVNLNGHTIGGTGAAGTIGVSNNGHSSVTVKNGAITGFNFGVNFQGSPGAVLSGLRVFDNATDGIYVDSKATITNNVTNHNGAKGIEIAPGTLGAVLTGNHALSNASVGIFVNTRGAASVTGNVANANGSDGIWLWPSSPPDPGDFSPTPITASGNKANWNDKLGINAGPGDVDLGKNLASGNGTAHQCENVVCSP